MTKTRLDSALAQAAARLPGPQPRFEAELLLGHALGRDRAWLFAHGERVLDADEHAVFGALLERRIAGEPVAYLIGARGFWSLDLAVQPGVLIPRPETELLVELALLQLADRGRVADLGTGSGAIALAIASERPQAQVTAVDISREALAVAQRNAIAAAPDHLVAGGWLLFEHGWTQGEAVRALLDAAGYVEVSTARDLEQRERVSMGRWP